MCITYILMSTVGTVKYFHMAAIFTVELQFKLFEHVFADRWWRTNIVPSLDLIKTYLIIFFF